MQLDSSAKVRVLKDGPVEVLSSVRDIGNGVCTVVEQVAAEAFGLSVDDTRFSEPDDIMLELGVDITLALDLGNLPVELKFGRAYLGKERDSLQSDFRYGGHHRMSMTGLMSTLPASKSSCALAISAAENPYRSPITARRAPASRARLMSWAAASCAERGIV